ncbi:MAG: sugar ABC transporter substrate-binding protein [Lachnospiraceae bacterium]|nr:sugar ABC transporter substrate-binding protein [Lachnospiraceae bacterium]
MAKRFFSFFLVLMMLAGVIFSVTGIPGLELRGEEEEESDLQPSLSKTTLILWYTDDALTDYLNREAARFNDASEDVRVIPVEKDGLGFLEEIGAASANDGDFPDLYITTHDNLEKAALAGLAAEVEHAEDILRGEHYCDAALSAVSWRGKKIAYPFYAETVALLYNRTYLEDAAKLHAVEDQEDPDDAELIEKRVAASLPETLTDLLDFAGHYNAPEQVEAVFEFDISDLFTDYFFAGDAINVGGPDGDDPDSFDLYNERTLVCMDIFQQMGQFFAADPDELNSDKVLTDLLEGRTVFTIATTDAVRRIAQAVSSEECPYTFGTMELMKLTDDLDTRALSVTNCIVINGFSSHAEAANRFARFLLDDGTDELYTRAGKMAAKYRADFGDDPLVSEMMQAYVSGYGHSVSMPKMIATSNFWVRLEVAYTDIWNGADVNETMRQVAEVLLSQIRGTPVTVDPIETPEQISISADLPED